jgi:Putative zinc-finger
MRCEECLTLVEAYHDGELERRRGERVSAHLAACADCAAALDALAFEQEIFLRYDRGLEVTPALWENVRAGVARLGETERAARPLPALTRLRQRLAATFAALNARTALASSLAMLLLGVGLGALWLSDSRRAKPAGETAAHVTPERTDTTARTPAQDKNDSSNNNRAADSVKSDAPAPSHVTAAMAGGRGGARAVSAALSNPNGAAPGGRGRGGDLVAPAPPDADHLETADDLLAPSRAAAAGADDVLAFASERLPGPAEKEMARHLEQAQTLLRSFQNSPAPAEGEAAQVAYERQLSRRLLADNAALQLEAETAGDESRRQVLDTLAPFLLDIANLRDDASREDVRPIKERMKKNEIVAALHVY